MILLKNCYYLSTFCEKTGNLKNYDVFIEDNIIKKISKNIYITPQQRNKIKIIDCSDYIVLPGFINTHHHFFQTLTRNLPKGQNAKLFPWLLYHYPIWENIDEEAIFYSTLLATAELLKTGTTTTSDHTYLYPKKIKSSIMQIQFDAALITGIRFSPSRGAMTLGKSKGGLPPDSVVQSDEEVLKDMEFVVNKFHDTSELSMKKIVFGPCSPFSVSKNIMIETAKLAREYKVKLHTHLAETVDENNYCLKKYNKRPLSLMEELNWLGDDVFFAHGIFFNDDELNTLKETKTGISHCPTSNMRLASGIARVREMLNLGIKVSLGVDGSASNDSSDMLGEIRNSLLLQRLKYGADSFSALDSLKLSIDGGIQHLGYKKLGKLKEGFGADISIFNMKKLQRAGSLSDPLASLVFTGYNHETEFTIVNGKIVVENKKLVGICEKELTRKANICSEKLIKNL